MFLGTYCLRVFYSFHNKYAYFVICENYIFLSDLYSFTKIDFLATQSAHTEFCDINLITTGFAIIDLLSILFLHLNQYVTCFLTYALKGAPLDSPLINFTNHLCNLKNEFNYFLLLCFCFKNLGLLDRQTIQFDFSLST